MRLLEDRSLYEEAANQECIENATTNTASNDEGLEFDSSKCNYKTYRVCNSDNDPISPDSWPVKFMLVNILKLSAVRLIKIGQNEQPSKIIKKVKTYMEVTRELVHSIPTQPPPQGSKPTQLDGVFVQLLPRAFRATAASKIDQIKKKKRIQYTINSRCVKENDH
jgi:hypothetical protein